MAKIFLFLVVLFSYNSHARKWSSQIDDSTKRRIFQEIMQNKNTAPFSYILEDFSPHSHISRVYSIAAIVADIYSVDADSDWMDSLRVVADNDYFIYNEQGGKFNVLGTFTDDSSKNPYIYPPSGVSNELLTEVSKYYNIDEVAFLGVYGVGICVLADNNIWIIKDNTRTDLKTYVKEAYADPKYLRAYFLFTSEKYRTKEFLFH